MSIHTNSRMVLARDADNLAVKKRALLTQLLEEEGLAKRDAIPRRNSTSPVPLSYAQQRIWFLDRLSTGNTPYRVQGSVPLRGPLNVDALRQSIEMIVERHETLRTTFPAGEDGPVQVIHKAGPIDLPIIDLSTIPESKRAAEWIRVLQEISQQPFDIERGPLVRAQLTRIAPDEHTLFIAMHHIISDGWSLQVFLRELGQFYASFAQGTHPEVPPLRLQYADFALWQRDWLQGETMEQQLVYWRRQLGGELPALELPRDHPRPKIQQFRGACQSLGLSPTLVEALKLLSRERRATLFTTLLAALQVLLARLSGHEDVLVGTPVSGRNRLETEDLIGFFIQTVVLRADLSGNPTFGQFLEQVRETAFGAQAHQDVPFEKVVEELHPQRDLGRTPIFQVFFNMVNVPAQEPVKMAGLEIGRITGLDLESKFDLTVYVVESGDTIRLDFLYNPELFDEPRIAEMARQYECILVQVSEKPERPVWSLSLVTPEARKHLPDPYLPLASSWYGAVHERFSEQARRSPHRLSVADAREDWTYGQLEKWSNCLANCLASKGVTKGDLVAIYSPRSASLVWAVLGVLKAGAAFLILDPSYPSSYLLKCLNACAPKAWIETDLAKPAEALATSLSGSAGGRRIQLPPRAQARSCDWLKDQPAIRPELSIGPEDLAYIAFTSGSTGEPKTILGTHRPLSHFIHWYSQTFGFSPKDRFSMLSGLSHDPLLRDVFTPLCVGASLHVPTTLADVPPRRDTQQEGESSQLARKESASRRVANYLGGLSTEWLRGADQAERHRILLDSNDTAREWNEPRCLVEILEAQVQRAPMRIAAGFGGRSLTYERLNARANQLAHFLRAAGVGANALVGICLERSLDMLVALLAVWKAGGAYIPLDPEYPPERIAFMLQDSGAPIVLTQQKLLPRFAPDLRIICIDGEWNAIGRHPATNLAHRVTAETLAHVIYTSGSTGKPKGVMISHAALTNFLLSMREKPGIVADDVMLAVTSLSFDIAGLELYLPLMVGARVEIASRDVTTDPVQLADRMKRTGATVMQATPATWQMLIESGWRGNRRLKVLCGGEALSRDLANQLMKRSDSVWNLYGPTETTIWSTVWQVQGKKGPVPIGKPIANTQIYVLDEERHPVPVGATSELYIAGDGLARGYLNRPELTAEKFLTNPYGRPGARIYRTGDLGRYRADGVIEHLGRIDSQVKVRGYRIELGEIEMALAYHPGIRQVVVVAREDELGDKRLVAYIIPSRQPPPGAGELRSYLRKRLPEYMVPSGWVVLGSFPLTPNGKVDRRALPAPGIAANEGEEGYSDPRTLLEEQKRLAEWLRSNRITVLHCTPPFLDVLAESQKDGSRDTTFPALRYAFFGGDCLTARHTNLLRLLAPAVTCVNFYGATETPQAMSYYVVRGGSEQQQEHLPIGRGIEGVQLLVLNRTRGLAGIGELGEIYVRTPYLAKGYLKEAAGVARFLPNHFTSAAGDRLFRSGDLGRYLPDGTVIYHGRCDDQVKIRGYRVEMQHVESVLRQHPSVGRCVVVADPDASGGRRLVGYFVPASRNGDGYDGLHEHMKAALPAYMVPTVLVPVKDIPLTANGKIDRRALPAPDSLKAGYVPPRSDVEQRLAQIWEKVLNVAPIGIRDDFFALGGHSLLAVRLFSAIEKAFQSSLPIATIFQAPTVEQFAALLEQKGWHAAYSVLTPIKSQGSAPPFFCVHSLGANLVSYAALAQRVGEDQPFYGLQPQGLDGRHPPHTCVEDMAAQYLEAIRSVQPQGPYYLGGVCLGGVIAFEMAQQLLAAGERVASLVLMDSYCPGSSRYLPTRTLDYGFIEQMDWHVGLMMLLPLPGKIRFLCTRAKDLSALLGYEIRGRIGRFVPAIAPAQAEVERIMTKVKAANSQAEQYYVPRYYPGKIVLFWCSEVPTRCYRDRRLAWSEVAGGGLEVHAIPGNHNSMVEPPHVEIMARTLRECLQKAQQETTVPERTAPGNLH